MECKQGITLSLLVILIWLYSGSGAYAQLSESELSPLNKLTPMQFGDPSGLPSTVGSPIKLKRKDKPTLSDLFPHKELNSASAQPISLAGVSIPGLSKEHVLRLGLNYFCVIANTENQSFSSLYEWNRLSGKPNFVTVDSFLHPYFGFKNALLGKVIEDSLYEDLGHLLRATIHASISDFREAADDEVKDDIQRNLAYLSVGLKLLEPDSKLPDIGGADKLVEADYEKVLAGGRANSSIFNQKVDFSYCAPWGWYCQSKKIESFFRSYQWLSRMYFPLRNVSVNTLSGGGNKFRRAVLLYRALTLGRVRGTPALDYWVRVGNAFALCGMDNYYRLHTILPPDLDPVLSRSKGDFDSLVHVVSQPYATTKLMLSIRKQRPVNLGSTSIFEIGNKQKKEDDLEVVRFFPLVQPMELNWLKHVAHEYQAETMEPTPTPLSLLTMHAHGSVCATNLLSMQLDTLDSRLLTATPRLERIVAISKGGRGQVETDGRWRVISRYFTPYSESVQVALRTNLWFSRQIESAMGAWIDSYTAYIPVDRKKAPPDKTAQAPEASQARPANFHYLEPRPVVFQMMSNDLSNVEQTLKKLSIFPEAYAKRLNDFRRLFGRLDSIATSEIDGKPIMKEDFSLLANIDRLLKPVDSPLPGTIFFNLGKSGETKEGEGATIGTGNAGQLYLICSTTQGATLCRGGVYTLFETGGGPYPMRHWLRKLNFDLLKSPIWTQPFDYFQKKNKDKKS